VCLAITFGCSKEGLFAQNQELRKTNWVFGDSNHLKFDAENNPVKGLLPCRNLEATASISDINGNLQLYFDSPRETINIGGQFYEYAKNGMIRDGNGNIIENGDSIFHYPTATNGTLFLPLPQSDSTFLFFTLAPDCDICIFNLEDTHTLYYTIIK
jgi:hypothetical protein